MPCKNEFNTQIGDDRFTVFRTGTSKSRETFLSVLRAGHTDYVVNTPPNNLAKLPFGLFVRLPRGRLRPGYGEGFLGAPVVICPRSGESRSGCGGADDPARQDGSEPDGAGQP